MLRFSAICAESWIFLLEPPSALFALKQESPASPPVRPSLSTSSTQTVKLETDEKHTQASVQYTVSLTSSVEKLPDAYVLIILFQECAFSFHSWTPACPADFSRTQGSAGFCCLVAIFHGLVRPTFANLWQLCHIPALLSISFSVFHFLTHQSGLCMWLRLLCNGISYWRPQWFTGGPGKGVAFFPALPVVGAYASITHQAARADRLLSPPFGSAASGIGLRVVLIECKRFFLLHFSRISNHK